MVGCGYERGRPRPTSPACTDRRYRSWAIDIMNNRRRLYLSIERPDDVERSLASLGLGADDVDVGFLCGPEPRC